MLSAIRSRCTYSAENCCLTDNNKVEAAAAEEDILASRSGIARHVHGDTEASTVPPEKSVSSLPSSKRLLNRPSQPPPPPPCPSGDNAKEEATAAVEGQLMSTSTAQMTELNLQLQQLLQQPRCRNRPGQRSPRRPVGLSACQPLLQVNLDDEKDEDEKDNNKVEAAAAEEDIFLASRSGITRHIHGSTEASTVPPENSTYYNWTDAVAVETAVSSMEIPIHHVLRDYDLDQTDDVIPQKLREEEDAAAQTELDDLVAAAADDTSSKQASISTLTSDFQRNIANPTAKDEVNPWSSSCQWNKRPCGMIVEEASLDELLEKTEKLEQELRKQLDIKKQKAQENARQEERIRVLEQTNAELRMKLTMAESELAKKDIIMAIIEENNGNLTKRLKSTRDVLTKLENDYERVVEEKLEFKSLYINCRFKSSEAIGDMREEINQQIEAKRSFIRLAKQHIPDRSAVGLKKALATTSDYLRLKCERNRLLDKEVKLGRIPMGQRDQKPCYSGQVQYLKTRVEAQDLYIEDLSNAVKELSRIIQHYKVSLPSMEEKDNKEQQQDKEKKEGTEQEEEKDHSNTMCAALTDESSENLSPTSDWTTGTSPEQGIGESEANLEEEELEDICDEASGSECLGKDSKRSTALEFRTPLSSPSLSIKSRTPRQTADDDDDDEKQE